MEALRRWRCGGKTIATIELRRSWYGWLLIERYGPLEERRRYLRASEGTGYYGSATHVAESYAREGGWVEEGPE